MPSLLTPLQMNNPKVNSEITHSSVTHCSDEYQVKVGEVNFPRSYQVNSFHPQLWIIIEFYKIRYHFILFIHKKFLLWKKFSDISLNNIFFFFFFFSGHVGLQTLYVGSIHLWRLFQLRVGLPSLIYHRVWPLPWKSKKEMYSTVIQKLSQIYWAIYFSYWLKISECTL